MLGVHDLWLFVAAGLLLNVTPGPDMAYIAARAATGGFRAGAAATLGITAGCVVHTVAAATGLSLLLATSATAFAIVKWCGAAYLAYAGVRLLIHATREGPVAEVPSESPVRARAIVIFREALFINVLNPKVALFFLAFLPQFIDPAATWPALSLLFLGTLFNINSLFVNLPVAWLAARAGERGRASARAVRVMKGAIGALFVFLAGRLAAAERS
jgi:threonine/homoserine/homoserine lactone efflux protein